MLYIASDYNYMNSILLTETQDSHVELAISMTIQASICATWEMPQNIDALYELYIYQISPIHLLQS